VNRLERLDLPADAEAEAVRRALDRLGEARQELKRIRRRLAGLAQAEAGSASEWRGGPDGLWGRKEARRDAEERRQQIAALADLCESQAVLAVVGGLQGPVDPGSVAWARTLHRMVRSPLSGQAAERTTGGSEDAGDPLVRWLSDEARAGLKRDDLQTYPTVTKVYLESLLDLLRY